MKQFVERVDRQQTMLLPEHLEGYVDENSPVCAIDAFADILISQHLATIRSLLPLVMTCPLKLSSL